MTLSGDGRNAPNVGRAHSSPVEDDDSLTVPIVIIVVVIVIAAIVAAFIVKKKKGKVYDCIIFNVRLLLNTLFLYLSSGWSSG